MKKCVIIAGINGAGKTTYYQRLNNDIKRMKRQELAGKRAKKNIFSFIENGLDYCQETALCGTDIIEEIQKAKDAGYFIEMHYIFLSSYKLAIERVHNRVSKGGHYVEDEMIVQRFQETIDNLILVCGNIDRLLLLDNSEIMVEVAEISDCRCAIYKDMYPLIIEKIKQRRGDSLNEIALH